MSKRKRDDFEDGEGQAARSTVDQRQLARFRGLVEQSRKSLATALKLARGFERQKMGRRQKNATQEPQILLRLREEVIVLKQLDLEKTANNHLVKSFIKSKKIRESPYFTTVYGLDPKLDSVSSLAEGNVLGRLFNSNPVKVAMSRIMKGMYETLGLEETRATAKISEEPKMPSKVKTVTLADEDLDPMEITPDEGSDDESEFASFSDEEDQYVQRRLLSPEDEVGEEHSGSESETEVKQQKNIQRSLRPADAAALESGSTAFLPSLSMGGYYSGGSDSSDDDEEANGPALPKERKNRRGQRARQELAEKKYGQKAKHLQKQSTSRNAGWDKQKGAVGTGGRRRDASAGGKNRANGRAQDAPPPKPKKRDDDGPIHPSWEAAKLRKSQAVTQAAFAGKKTTFD